LPAKGTHLSEESKRKISDTKQSQRNIGDKKQGGVPMLFTDPDALLEKGLKFFDWADENKKPYTISGLANWLGVNRNRLNDYVKKEKFTHVIETLKSKCEQYAEERLFGNNPTGSIFWLKNAGWTDRQSVEMSGHVVIMDPAPITKPDNAGT
jgi:hypothetical protein